MSRYFFSAVSLQGFNAEQIDLINRVAETEYEAQGREPMLEEIKADYADELNALAPPEDPEFAYNVNTGYARVVIEDDSTGPVNHARPHFTVRP